MTNIFNASVWSDECRAILNDKPCLIPQFGSAIHLMDNIGILEPCDTLEKYKCIAPLIVGAFNNEPDCKPSCTEVVYSTRERLAITNYKLIG